MPEINNNFNNSSFSKKSEENNKKRSKLPSRGQLFIVFSLVILFVAGTFLFIYLNPEAIEKRKAEKNTEDFIKIYEGWEKQLSEDKYGGKTPQETLDMFIEALRSGDLELASKFFSPEIDEDNPEELTWQGHLEYLKSIKEKGYLERMVNDLENYDNEENYTENTHLFIYRNEEGSTGIQIAVHFNKDSGVWKIENFYE